MFSDLAHSARPSAVTAPSTAERQLAAALAFPNQAQRGAGSSSPPPSHAPGPQPLPLPPLESRLSGVLEAGGAGRGSGEHRGFGKMTGSMQSSWLWSVGRKRVEPRTTVGKNSCSYSQPQHVAPHRGQPRALSCLEQWPPAGFCRSPHAGRRARPRAEPTTLAVPHVSAHHLASACLGRHGSLRPQASLGSHRKRCPCP